MSNFSFLSAEPDFSKFASIAITAEKLLPIDFEASIIKCRKAMEVAVKWMYSVDIDLQKKPLWDNHLVTLMSEDCFRSIVGNDLYKRMDFIRLLGNEAIHSDKNKIKPEAAMLCLQNLHIFMDFVAHCYSRYDYEQTVFNPELIGKDDSKAPEEDDRTAEIEIQLEALIKENEALKAELTAKREAQQQTYVPQPLEVSEFQTRQLYIDVMLNRAGWERGRNWSEEVELHGMPTKSGLGFVDYALYGDDGKILAIVEAKKTCVDVASGRQQAKLYADIIEKQQGRRPVIFLTNGFDTRIVDNNYPERRIAEIYSKRDLEKLFNLRKTRLPLKNATIKKEIADRYYQLGAIKSVCETFDEKNRRKVLLVMATGSGKTRTVIALCDVLLRQGWVKNILFLADRNALVTQAKRSFTNLLPDLSTTNLCEEKDNFAAHCVFSTYNTMMNCIDSVTDEEGRLFTSGHFDLIICDEAHRSIYNKYQDIFNYFDAPLVGLTATPKDDIDKNTYEVFELRNNMPTYSYDLAQAVKDGCLVDFAVINTKLKFIEEGIRYDELSDEDKAAYEATFGDEEGNLPDSIDASAINTWVFNIDTIREVLSILMTQGLKVDYGNRLGKTIIFAKNHKHAEKILQVFNKEYPHLVDYAKVIDNQTKYSQSAIDEFSEAKKLPQIAISVDMLDTGIDVPEILNLVFFKKVKSKAKFWQMIGRGTRLCKGLLDGNDKKEFYIFDFCSNFDFFRVHKDGEASAVQLPIQGALFAIKLEMIYKLNGLEYQTPKLRDFRDNLVDELSSKVRDLNRENFSIRQHLKIVELYSDPKHYDKVTYADTLEARAELAPLIEPENDDASALRFDALLYGMELASLHGQKHSGAAKDVKKLVGALSKSTAIPAVAAKADLIARIVNTDYLDNATFDDFEHIRTELRDLMKYIEIITHPDFHTNFNEQILASEWCSGFVNEIDDMQDYRTKAEFYLRQNQDNPVIAKLKNNQPLDAADVKTLKDILWSEIGSENDYRNTCGETDLGCFVRSLIGLDMKAAKEAFAEFLDESKLDSDQIYFVNQVVEYIVKNGIINNMRILQEEPFNAHGSIIDLFKDMTLWQKIKKTIDSINLNAMVSKVL